MRSFRSALSERCYLRVSTNTRNTTIRTHSKQSLLPFLQDFFREDGDLLLVLHIDIAFFISLVVIIVHRLRELVSVEVEQFLVILLQELVELGILLRKLGKLGQMLLTVCGCISQGIGCG